MIFPTVDWIDTHQHLLYPGTFDYPWAAGIPPLRGAFALDDYWDAASGTPISGTVFVEVDVPEQEQAGEAQFVCRLAEDEASRILGVVASGRPENDGFEEYLDRISHPKLKGLRRVLHAMDDGIIQMPRFAQNVALLGPRGLTFDLCVLPRQLPLALELVRECPGTLFILDHCGIPDVKARSLDPWRDDLAAIAEARNVVCKLSGIATYAEPGSWTIDDLRPFSNHVLSVFGWERVMFGSDWPVCNLAGGMRKWVATAAALTAAGSESQRRALYAGNAIRIYRL